jgi:membrane-bound serine protease (ClpP class)
MRRVPVLLVLVLACASLWPAWAGAQTPGSARPSSDVRIIKVSGALDRPLVGFVYDEMDRAEKDGDTIVLQLDSAGMLDQDALALAWRVAGAKVPVIVFVGPTPAKATGGALLLMYASSLTAVAPGSQTGPIEPLDLARPDENVPNIEAKIRSWLAARGKSGADPVPPTVPLPAQAALDRGIAQVASASVPALLGSLDGRTVQTPGGPVQLHTALRESGTPTGVSWSFADLGPVKRIEHAMVSPSAIYLLLVLGLAGLAFELIQPGFGFAGFAGIGSLLLAAYGLLIVPFSWLGMVVLVGGVGLMVLDVRVRKLGVTTAVGLILFVAGSVLLFRGVSAQIDLSPWLIGSLTIASLLYYGFALTVALQSRDRIASTQRGLIGLLGEARGELSPEGPVFVKGALWRGRSADEPIPSGTPVRVRGVDGLILRVAAEPGAGPDPDPGPGAGSSPDPGGSDPASA